MASESDQVVFEKALEPSETTALFQSKKWAYIVDQASNGGVFTGQMQFNLTTLANLNQWTNLAEAEITFPIRYYIKNVDGVLAANQKFQPSMLSACIKNGFHNFVDSVQFTLGGTTIQNAQIYENVNCTYKLLSEMSLDEYNKVAPSLGLGLDDVAINPDITDIALNGDAQTLDLAKYFGLANRSATDTIQPYKGFVMQAEANKGFQSRCHHLNNYISPLNTANTILVNSKSLGRGQFTYAEGATAGNNIFTGVALGLIRLKDICDVAGKLPAMKNPKGFIYVNYNSGDYTFTMDKSGDSTSIKSASASTPYGRCMPAMIGRASDFVDKDNTTALMTDDFKVQFCADVFGGATDGLTPPQQNARLHVPYFVANPDIDRALSQKKTIRYNERFVTSFTVAAQQSHTATLSPGIVNPKRVILLPLLTGTNSGTAPTDNVVDLSNLASNPEASIWSHEGCGSSPFAAINNLQFIVGGVPMFQTPVDMDFQTFLHEVNQQGADGGLELQSGSGLLNQRLWDQLYRYYTCDIGRRTDAEDGASKSVQVQMTNATKAPMRVIAMIWYEREIEIDTVMGSVTQGI